MKRVLLFLILAVHAFAVSPVARWPLDDQNETGVIRDVVGTNHGTWFGTNLITNGDFETGDFTGWSTHTTPGTEIDTNACKFTHQAGTVALGQDFGAVFGKMYVVSYEVIANPGSLVTSLNFRMSGFSSFGNTQLSTVVGIHTDTYEAVNASPSEDLQIIMINTEAGETITIDNISVREASVESNGTGIVFDGVGDYVDIGTGPAVVKTISLWINQDDVAGNEYPIDLNGTDYLSVESGVVTVNGLAGHTLYVDGVAGTSGVTTIDATWHNIVITDSTNNDASDLDIGRADIGPAVYFAGKISDVRIYNVVLTADQVKGLFRGEGRKQRSRYNNKEYEPGNRSRYN